MSAELALISQTNARLSKKIDAAGMAHLNAPDPHPQYTTAAEAAAAAPVQSVAGKAGVVTLAKSDVGLGNVDNTSDTGKPISAATQTALNTKQDTLVSGTTIKTINGASLLGSGNLLIESKEGFSTGDVVLTADATKTTPKWVVANGAVLNRGVYPLLDAILSSTRDLTIPEKIANPSVLLGADANGVAISNNGQYLISTSTTTPFVKFYSMSNGVISELPQPASLPTGAGKNASITEDGLYACLGTTVSPFLEVYKRIGNQFTKITPPAAGLTASVNSVSFSKDGAILAVGSDHDSRLKVYSRAGDLFKLLSFTDTLAAPVKSVCVSSNGKYVAVATDEVAGLTIFEIAGTDLVRVVNKPYALLPVQYGRSVGLSGDATVIAFVTGQHVRVFKRNSDLSLTQLTVNTPPPASIYTCAVSNDGNFIIIGTFDKVTPFYLYKRNVDVFNPVNIAVNPLHTGSGQVGFSVDNTHFVVGGQASPYFTIYSGADATLLPNIVSPSDALSYKILTGATT